MSGEDPRVYNPRMPTEANEANEDRERTSRPGSSLPSVGSGRGGLLGRGLTRGARIAGASNGRTHRRSPQPLQRGRAHVSAEGAVSPGPDSTGRRGALCERRGLECKSGLETGSGAIGNAHGDWNLRGRERVRAFRHHVAARAGFDCQGADRRAARRRSRGRPSGCKAGPGR